MKPTIITLAASAALSLAALADEAATVTIPNAHGQSTVLFRDNTPSVALYTGGGSCCASGACSDRSMSMAKPNGHGQATILYRCQ